MPLDLESLPDAPSGLDLESLPDAPSPEVQIGQAPPVAENAAARRRVLMAVPSAGGEDLGVLPMPGVEGPAPDPQRLADNTLAAYRASKAGITPERAAQALKVSRLTGFSPQFSADTLDESQAHTAQQDMADKLARAPAMASFAHRGAVEASAINDDMDHLSFLEWAITGRWELAPVAPDVPFMMTPRLATPPFWLAAFKDAMSGEKFAALAGKKGTVGLTPDETETLDQLRQDQSLAKEYGAHNLATKALVGTVKVLPSLAVIGGGTAAGGVVAGPPGAFAGGTIANFAQTYGPLYDSLSRLTEEDGVTPLLTENEARGVAAAGALATSVAAQWVGGPLLKKLPGVREILGKAAGEGVTKAMAQPAVAKLLTDLGLKFGKNYISGIAMMMAQRAGEQTTIEAAKLSKAKGSDEELLWKAMQASVDVAQEYIKAGKQAAQDLPLISAYGPVVETIGAVGRGHAEQAHLAGMVENAKASKLVGREPGTAAEVIAKAADQPGAADTAYIPKEAWDAFHGDNAQRRAAELAKDGGRAYAEADATGGPVAIPIEQHLTAGLGDAEKLLPDTKLSPDSLTPNEAKPAIESLAKSPAVPVEPPAPSRAESASYRDAAREFIEHKAISDIRPDYYDAAVLRAGKEAVSVASERDRAGQKILAEYAKALDATEEQARAAIGAARKGFYGAGMQAASDGELGTSALREAGRSVDTAERRLGRTDKELELKLASLEAQHVANEEGRQRETDMLLQQQQLSQQAAKMARDVREEMDNLQARIGTADRGALAAGDPTYLGAYDAIHSALDGTATPGALDGALAAMQRDGARVRFDEGAVADLLANPRPWSKLTPIEARNLADAVANIRAAASRAHSIADGDRRASLREVAASITAEVSQMPSKTHLLKQSGVTLSPMEQAQLTLNAWNGVLLRPKTNLSFMGETAKRVLFDRMIDARNLRNDFMRGTGEFYREIVGNPPAELRKLGSQEVKVGEYLLTLPGTDKLDVVPRALLWKLHLETSSEGNRDRVLGGNGWNGDKVDQLLYRDPATKLTRGELDFLQSILDHNNEHVWPLLKAKEERLDGVAPPKIDAIPHTVTFEDGTSKTYEGGYHPLSRDTRYGITPANAQGSFQSVEDFFGPNYQRAETFKPFAKERAANASYVVDLDWDTIVSHMTQVLHDIAFDEPIRDIGRLVLDPEFQRAAVSALGPEKAAQIPAWVRSVATQGSDSIPQNLAVVGGAFGFMRRRMITAIVGDSIPLAMLQSSHIPFVLIKGDVGGIHGLPALLSVFKPFTLGDDGVRLFPTWKDSYAESTELQHRDIRNTRRVLEDINKLPRPTNFFTKGIEGWRGLTGIFMHAIDRYLSTWIYTATKNEALANGAEPKEAIDYANGKVQDLLPTHDLETAPPLLTSRNVGSLLIMHGFQNTVYNMRQEGIRQTALDFHDADTPAEYARAGVSATWRIARWTAALAALGMGEIAGGHGADKDKGETWGEWMLRRSLAAQGMDIPWIGPLLDPIASLFVSKVTTGVAQVHPISVRQAPTLALVQKGADLLGDYMRDGVDDEKKFFDTMEMTLVAAGVPSRQVRITSQYLWDLYSGNVKPRGPLDVAGGVVFGQKVGKPQSRNPFTAAQDALSGD